MSRFRILIHRGRPWRALAQHLNAVSTIEPLNCLGDRDRNAGIAAALSAPRAAEVQIAFGSHDWQNTYGLAHRNRRESFGKTCRVFVQQSPAIIATSDTYRPPAMTISSVGSPAAQPLAPTSTTRPTAVKSQTPAAVAAPVSKPDGDTDGGGGRINVKA